MNVHEQFATFFPEQLIQPFAYLVVKHLFEGHICVDVDAVDLDEAFAGSKFANSSVDKKHLLKSDLVGGSEADNRPFVLSKGKLYLHRYYRYESQIIKKISDFVDSEKSQISARQLFLDKNKAFVHQLNAEIGKQSTTIEKIDWQLAGALMGFQHNFTVITGGPGTGKTTTVAKILALLYLENTELKVALTAPTGKAGIRMLESLKENDKVAGYGIKKEVEKLESSTIHRLLGYRRNSPYFRHDEENYLPHDVVIVDEASMIDVSLFAKLLNAIDPNSRVILLGDKDQLASVEAGSMLGDLSCSQFPLNFLSKNLIHDVNKFIIDAEGQIPNTFIDNKRTGLLKDHIVELKKSHRFAKDSGIGKLSDAIILSDANGIKSFFDTGDPAIELDEEYSTKQFNSFVAGYSAYIGADIEVALESINNLKVLCAVRKGPQGKYVVNERIEQVLVRAGLLKVDDEFYENRPIIVTKNFKDLELYNGDIGIIRTDVDGVKKVHFLDSQNNVRKVLPGYIPACETVFAMTIHKSQGSEYKNVMVILPKKGSGSLLTKELLYTAVTRAKEKVLLQATKEGILAAASRSVNRASGISNRIK